MGARLPSGANPPAAIAAGSLSLLGLFLFAVPLAASFAVHRPRFPRPILLGVATAAAMIFLLSLIMAGILIFKRGLHSDDPLLLAAYYVPIVCESMLPVSELFQAAPDR